MRGTVRGLGGAGSTLRGTVRTDRGDARSNRAIVFADGGTVPSLRGTDLQGALTSIQTDWAEVEKDVSYGSPVDFRVRTPAFSIQDLP